MVKCIPTAHIRQINKFGVTMKNGYFFPADILLPDSEKVSYQNFAVIACDQYTSEPEYWEETKRVSDGAYSAYNIILPEVYLSEATDERISTITETMEKYLKQLFIAKNCSMLYIERALPSNGRIRHGIIGMVDLEAYDYSKGSTSAIRATEGTVLERIPPRVRIRCNAPVESPHVMLFCDDAEKTVIEPLSEIKNELEKAYDFELMQGGGHITGWFLDDERIAQIDGALCALSDLERFNAKYGVDEKTPLVFAVGDGNHSLATAKACYERLKSEKGAAAVNSLSRYALVELVNIHDESIEFEPIYRVIMNCDPSVVLKELTEYGNASLEKTSDRGFTYDYYTADSEGKIYVNSPATSLPVGDIQDFLFKFSEKHPECEIDYIHGIENLKALASKPQAIGFIFDGMRKDELFPSVIKDGALPRKTFSMGHADDKRFYLECRRIKD